MAQLQPPEPIDDLINAAQVQADVQANQFYQSMYSGGMPAGATGKILYGGVQTTQVPNAVTGPDSFNTHTVQTPANYQTRWSKTRTGIWSR